MSAVGTFSTTAGMSSAWGSFVPATRSVRAKTRSSTQVGAWTPFVTLVIGTSSASNPGHSGLNISRLTTPWSWATPLARWARRRPSIAMLKMPPEPPS